VLAQLLQECAPIPAWISFTCKDRLHTAEGERIGDCVTRLAPYPQVIAVGVNCTHPELMVPLLEEMRAHTDKPLLVYPNSGEHYDGEARCWTGRAEDAPFAAGAKAWCGAGARLIGGCCRTTPADIRALRRVLS
jgi:homocysteine S-methyltransferase